MTIPFATPTVHRENLEKQAGYDVWLLAVTLTMCVCGAIFVLTSSAAHSYQQFGGDSMAIFRNHISRMAWGLVCMAVLAFVDYHWVIRMARPILLTAVVTLIAVLFWPQPAGATAHRWIYYHGFSFQPAEFSKFALINYLAFRFGSRHDDPFLADKQKVYYGALIICLVVFSLILLEPNLSMAVLTLGSVSLIFFLSGIRLKPLFVLGGVCVIPFSAIAWLTPYMHSRLTAYADGIVNPFHAGYHVRQSLIGIGQGGLFGLGLGGSTQKHFFLPEPHKDFIFSIVSEELGLLGAVLVLIGFVLLLARAWRITRHTPDGVGYFLAAGITTSIALSFVINVGVTLGLLPATGQPLPFISYGGTSLMMTLGAVGILLNISKQTQRDNAGPRDSYRFP